MRRKKVVVVAGTRPEVIKMAPVYFQLKESEVIKPIFLSTGQHKQMLDQAFQSFNFKPDFDLKLMEKEQTLTGLTSKVLTAASKFFEDMHPDAVLVQGDTTSVLSSSLAAFYNKIPVGHVEAGLRTHNLNSPWPEEMNRLLTDPISRWCFTPTSLSKENLIKDTNNYFYHYERSIKYFIGL